MKAKAKLKAMKAVQCLYGFARTRTCGLPGLVDSWTRARLYAQSPY